jgi:hypothetical protein
MFWKIVRSSVILILPLFISFCLCKKQVLITFRGQQCSLLIFGGIRVAHPFSFLCSYKDGGTSIVNHLHRQPRVPWRILTTKVNVKNTLTSHIDKEYLWHCWWLPYRYAFTLNEIFGGIRVAHPFSFLCSWLRLRFYLTFIDRLQRREDVGIIYNMNKQVI